MMTFISNSSDPKSAIWHPVSFGAGSDQRPSGKRAEPYGRQSSISSAG